MLMRKVILKIKYLYIILLCSMSSLYIQSADWTWSHAYGKEWGWEIYNPVIVSANDGGYAIVGEDSNDNDIVLIKIYPSGSIAWQKIYKAPGYDGIMSFQQTKDGGYLIGGYTDSYGAGDWDALIIKVDSSGNIMWQKVYGGALYDISISIVELEDGTYIIGGETSSFGAGERNISIMRLDKDGSIIWQKTYSGTYSSGLSSIQKTFDGNIVVNGGLSLAENEPFQWIFKIDLSGNIIWQKIYDVYLYVYVYSVQATSDAGYIMAGEISFGSYEDAWVCKLDSDGNIVWQKSYGDIYSDFAEVIMQTLDGGYLINARRGYLKGDSTDYDIWMFKLDSSGNIIWQKSYYTSYWEFSSSMDFTQDGGYIIVAESPRIVNSDFIHAWVFKIREDGTMDSSCDFIYDTNVIPQDTNVTVTDSSIVPMDSSAIVSEAGFIGLDFDMEDTLICQTSNVPILVSQKPLLDDSSGSNPNGIIEADEEVNLLGALENIGDTQATLINGHLSSYSPIIIQNGSVSYPDIASKGIENALMPYAIIAPSSNRPSTHWDIDIHESPKCSGCMDFMYDFKYHVGSSFNDVPPTTIFYPYIEKILHTGIVNGCTESSYCPLNPVTREQMAKMVCRSMNQYSASCPVSACQGIFADVPSSNIFCSYIEGLYNAWLGIVSGCLSDPLSYCPLSIALREQMAKILCNAMDGAWVPGGCTNVNCEGLFNDVPSSNPFCSHIEALYKLDIVSGCSLSPLLFCPKGITTRQQMAKLLVNAFGFSL